jgi:DNA repair exonuclease SbcCD nuclease subunit
MKVAIITDQHFGARNDSIVFLDFFQKFYDNVFFPTIDDHKIKTVLILGDTFDRRKYVNFYALKRAKEMFFDRLAERNINVIMIAGNHDTYYKNTNDVNSPELLLQEYDNITIISNPQTIHLDYENPSCDVLMLPWICAENYAQTIQEITNTSATLCMGHLEISGFAMYKGMESHEGMDKKTFEKFDLVFSGHYHHRSNDGQIYYLGNPYELTWQDYRDPRGFHLFSVHDRQLEFIVNPYSMFVRIEYDDNSETGKTIDLDSMDLKDCFVKLVVVNKTDLYKFDKFTAKLYTKGCAEIKIIENFSEYEEGTIDGDINLEDTMSVLDNYIDSIQTDADKERIKQYMKALYTEAVNMEVA